MLSPQHKRSRGARNDNGEQLDRGREKAGSRIDHYNRTFEKKSKHPHSQPVDQLSS